MHDYNCPDCNEAKLQSDKNTRKINEVINQVNALIQVINETVNFIEEKAEEKVEEIVEIKANEVAERKVNKILNDLNSNINEINQEIDKSKMGYFGEIYNTLKDRLVNDFDNVHQRINESELIPYEGTNIKADNSYYGLQKDTVIKGRTLQNTEGIESVGDKSKNLIPNEYSIIDKSYLDENENPVTEVQSLVIADYIKVNPNKTYTLSAYGVKSTTLRLYGYDINKNRISKSINQGVSSVSISGCDYIRVSTFKTNIDVLQLEEGTQATPYEPYYDGYKISGKSIGKNLIDVSKFNPNNDKITIDGDCILINEPTTIQPTLVDNLNIPLNGDYVFIPSVESGNYTGGNVILHFADGGKSEKPVTTPGYKYTMENRILTKITIYAPRGTARIKLFLSEGSDINTPYEPYQESIYSYILNEPLRGLPDGTCDEINLKTGVLTRRVGKVVLDGEENWEVTRNDSLTSVFSLSFRSNNNMKDIICDTFNGTFISGMLDGIEGIKLNNLSIFINILNNKLTTVDVNGFKQWLSENPTTVIYELAEPIIEQLSPCQLKSFDTTTHIISDNKLMPIVSTKIPSNVQVLIANLMDKI